MRRCLAVALLAACTTTPSGAPDGGAHLDADPAAPDADPRAPDAAPSSPDAAPPSASLGVIVTPTLFEQLFPHRGDSPCGGAFYTYQAFLAAAGRFPAFAASGTDDDRRREVAAFLANISHETTGGWPTAPDGPYAWGLCWLEEGPGVPRADMPSYCVYTPAWPCAAGEKYYGRGPLQLSYNFNYGPAGVALGADLLAHPNLVATDPELSFATALWFWMTPQPPKPSSHEVMIGAFTPSAADVAAGRVPGFGLTIDIINGGVECGGSSPTAQVQDRIGFYQRYADLLAVTPGAHLDCSNMQPY